LCAATWHTRRTRPINGGSGTIPRFQNDGRRRAPARVIALGRSIEVVRRRHATVDHQFRSRQVAGRGEARKSTPLATSCACPALPSGTMELGRQGKVPNAHSVNAICNDNLGVFTVTQDRDGKRGCGLRSLERRPAGPRDRRWRSSRCPVVKPLPKLMYLALRQAAADAATQRLGPCCGADWRAGGTGQQLLPGDQQPRTYRAPRRGRRPRAARSWDTATAFQRRHRRIGHQATLQPQSAPSTADRDRTAASLNLSGLPRGSAIKHQPCELDDSEETNAVNPWFVNKSVHSAVARTAF
jgi:hypothetical protein